MNWDILMAMTVHWYISLFCQTFFLHRYSSHGMFKMPYWADRFFYLLTFMTQGASFLNPRAYALLHQKHHQFSDTAKDPHSPHVYKNIYKMMVKTFHDYHNLVRNPVGERDSHYYPTWKTLDDLAKTKLHTLFWISLYLFAYSFIVTKSWQYVFVLFHLLVGPLQGAAVNWFGHKVGYRNFPLNDQSRNTLPVDILLMGELYQNNHHQHPMDLNFAKRWFEWDPTYPIIYFLKKVKLIY